MFISIIQAVDELWSILYFVACEVEIYAIIEPQALKRCKINLNTKYKYKLWHRTTRQGSTAKCAPRAFTDPWGSTDATQVHANPVNATHSDQQEHVTQTQTKTDTNPDIACVNLAMRGQNALNARGGFIVILNVLRVHVVCLELLMGSVMGIVCVRRMFRGSGGLR